MKIIQTFIDTVNDVEYSFEYIASNQSFTVDYVLNDKSRRITLQFDGKSYKVLLNETLETKDITLHINHTVIGLICKIIDKKEGVNGLKRLLTYDNMEILFKKEFNLQKKDWHHFL